MNDGEQTDEIAHEFKEVSVRQQTRFAYRETIATCKLTISTRVNRRIVIISVICSVDVDKRLHQLGVRRCIHGLSK